MTIREGKWKCQNCSTVNRGASTQCEQCGTTRDANVKFFLDDEAAEVTDAEQLAKAQAGADWLCEFCGNSNPAGAAKCKGCDAPRSKKEKAHGDVIPVAGAAPPPPPAPPPAKSSFGPIAIGALVVMLLMCCFCGIFMFRTKTETATVASVAWERKIPIQEIKPVKKDSWDSAPQGAYDITHRREPHPTRKVQTGTHTEYVDEKVQTGTRRVVTGHRNLGNGHFEDVTKDEPIYETRKRAKEVPTYEPERAEHYYYTMDEWVTVDTKRKKGSSEPPDWPPVNLAGGQREGQRSELYLLTFHGSFDKVMKAPSEAPWSKFKPGSSWTVQFNSAGSYTVLDAGGQPTDLETTSETID